MALHIIYGSSVSLKTESIYEMILREAAAQPERNFVMLVPDQASLTVQESLIRRSPVHGLMNIDILTFNRLAYRVFEEANLSEGQIIDETGKLMLLRLVSAKVAPSLKVLKRNLNREGFLQELKSLISELVQYSISPEQLEKSAEELKEHPLLMKKLQDIALIYREFMELLHRDYEMAEERMIRLSHALREWPKLENTVIALDGFTGFTPPQYEILSVLLGHCPEVILGVTMGSGRDPRDHMKEEDLFYMSAHMASEVKAIAISCGKEIEEQRIDAESGAAAEICHIEHALFAYPKQIYQGGASDTVRILRAANAEQEVRLVLSEILKGIREGIDFRDMAVICGDPEAYRDEIETRFGEAGVPYFIDARQPLKTDPLVLLVGNVFDVIEEGFSHDFVINLMKNPLMLSYYEQNCAESEELSTYERVCEVENYALSLGIRGKNAWEREFKLCPSQTAKKRLPVINCTKSVMLAPVFTLAEEMKDADNVRSRLTVLVRFLEAIGVWRTMMRTAKELGEQGNDRLQKEYEKSYEVLMDLFSEMEQILGDRELPLDEFCDVLKAGLSGMALGMVPPTKDRVVIGDLRRTRLGNIRRLFVIGTNEGVLPKKPGEGGLLSEIDREILSDGRLRLAPSGREESFNAQFYLYLLLTKPTESLLLTYARTGSDGKSMLPSYLIGMVKGLFPAIEIEDADRYREQLINTPTDGLNYLADGLRAVREDRQTGKEPNAGADPDRDAALRTVRIWFDRNPVDEAGLGQIYSGYFYRYNKETLSAETARKLFSDTLSGSVTRLESFAGCAFRHFLNYGLGLKERDVYEIDRADLGSILHESINRFFVLIEETGESWQELTDERRHELAQKCAEEVAAEYNNEILSDSARNAQLIRRVVRMTDRTLWALTKQWKAGKYTETESELAFTAEDCEARLKIKLDNGMELLLNGRIDRVDTAETENGVYVKIIDYKSGEHDVDLTEVYYGLQLQLPIYMEAALGLSGADDSDKPVIPAGMYYYHIDDPIVESTPEDAEASIYKELRMRGLTNSSPEAVDLIDGNVGRSSEVVVKLESKNGVPTESKKTLNTEAMELVGAHALRKSKELAEDILNGKIDVNPYQYGAKKDGCQFCGFKSICGFDTRIDGFERVRLKARDIEDFMQESKDDQVDE